ncbi:MAG: DNA damage-inducible protein D [Chloroflexota bacterium]|nr:DNA damage-inducible protein D [Chloroflexota bacterium]
MSDASPTDSPAPLLPETPVASPFAQLGRQLPNGSEYWLARELARLLGYTDYRNFGKVVDKARIACANSGHAPADHFVDVNEMVTIGSGAQRKVADVQLSRYACYLVVQNADPEKETVALGQTYFAVQTQLQEQADALAGLSEAQRRLYFRHQLTDHNRQLAATAREAGVIEPHDFAIFMDHGYMGLYAGERTEDIHSRKGLQPNQRILDHMGSEELAANLFRSTQAEAQIRREGIQGKEPANQAHEEMGRRVRQFIADVGGTMPENLPAPAESIQQLEQAERARLKRGPQLSLFDLDTPNPQD